MTLTWILKICNLLITSIENYPYYISNVILIFSTFIDYIFPFFLNDTLIIIRSFAITKGSIIYSIIFFFLFLGSLFGCITAYILGYLISNKYKKWKWGKIFINSKIIKTTNIFYQKYEAPFLIFNKFLPGIRAVFIIGAGFNKRSFFKVLLLGSISSLLWNGLILILCVLINVNLQILIYFLKTYITLIYILIIILIYFTTKNIYKQIFKLIKRKK